MLMITSPRLAYAKREFQKRGAAQGAQAGGSKEVVQKKKKRGGGKKGGEDRSCAVCRKVAEDISGGCKKVFYCSREHQQQHWKEHKPACATAKAK